MELSKIVIYPIKSLDGVSVESISITAGGSLQFDRRYALTDASGKLITAKRFPQIHQLMTTFAPDFQEVSVGLRSSSENTTFSLPSLHLAKWFTDFFGFPVQMVGNDSAGFPDDVKASGPTLTCESSFERVSSWFPGLTIDNVRRRFRTNLELNAPEPFWEDNLFGEAGIEVEFQIGSVRLLGHNPCQRCAVPARDPDDGAAIPDFPAHFGDLRKASLPTWANIDRFNHFYRFALNTSIPPTEAGKTLRLGDVLTQSSHGY